MRNMKLHDAPKPEATTKPKERHIVTWTQEEDDILREQISIHGTENWTIIAAKFKDKTTRQCRRRWYTYLNTDCKKGGWSPEEDMILCEAQKIFGNRWTEISKVVSGRTDNAVKNRFSTLCKKRAKREALSKENNISCRNPNNKRVIYQNGFIINESSESTPPLKKMRSQILDLTENTKGESLRECGENHQLRPPFAVLVQNFHNICNLSAQQHVSNDTKAASNDVAADDKGQVTFLRRDDPKITALMQQAELLSSLALRHLFASSDNLSIQKKLIYMRSPLAALSTAQDQLSSPMQQMIKQNNIKLKFVRCTRIILLSHIYLIQEKHRVVLVVAMMGFLQSVLKQKSSFLLKDRRKMESYPYCQTQSSVPLPK